MTQSGLTLLDNASSADRYSEQHGNVLDNDLNLFGEVQAKLVLFDGRDFDGKQSLELVNDFGAKVQVSVDGNVSYDPKGVALFRRLRRGQSLTESFVYQVDNFVHTAQAYVSFTVFGANRWHNSRNALDVDNDQSVSPLDVLNLVNDLNINQSRVLPDDPSTDGNDRFLDFDDDGSVSPLDVLFVINYLNQSRLRGEGENPNFENYWTSIHSQTCDWWLEELDLNLRKRGSKKMDVNTALR